MTYNEIWKIVETSEPDDWVETQTADGVVEIVYRNDLNVRFIDDYACEVEKDFQEPWANKHPNAQANKHEIRLYYASSCIESIPVVSVDGGRASLPLPEINTNEVPFRYYKAAKIGVQGNQRLDEYIERSKLVVK